MASPPLTAAILCHVEEIATAASDRPLWQAEYRCLKTLKCKTPVLVGKGYSWVKGLDEEGSIHREL